jgi:hypothetical protein
MRLKVLSCLWVMLYVAIPLPLAAAGKSANEAVLAAELAAAIRARFDAYARRDAASWGRYVADDCFCWIASKQHFQQEIAARPAYVVNYYGPLQDLEVRSIGTLALARYRVSEFSGVTGKTIEQRMVRMETFERRSGRWVLVAGAQSTLARDPVAVRLEPRLLDDYPGRYESAPGLFDEVVREGPQLKLKTAGMGSDELSAAGRDVFFIKGSPGRYLFVRDPRGAVTAMKYQLDEQEWTQPRIR